MSLTRSDTSTTAQESILVIVMGSRKVGKKSIVKQYLSQRVSEGYKTADRHFIQTDQIRFSIVATGAFNDFIMRKLAIRTGDAFVLVYAIDDEQSFDHITSLRHAIVEERGDTVPVVVVGNKNDKGSREVIHVVFDCVVTIDWNCPHFEVSAWNYFEITRVFEHLFSHQYIRMPLAGVGRVISRQMSLDTSRHGNKQEKHERSLMDRVNFWFKSLFKYK